MKLFITIGVLCSWFALATLSDQTPKLEQLPCLDEMSSSPRELKKWDEVKTQIRTIRPKITDDQLKTIANRLINQAKASDPHCKPEARVRDAYPSNHLNESSSFAGRQIYIRNSRDEASLAHDVKATKLPFGKLVATVGSNIFYMRASKMPTTVLAPELKEMVLRKPNFRNEDFSKILKNKTWVSQIVKGQSGFELEAEYQALVELISEAAKEKLLAADFDPKMKGALASLDQQIEKNLICPEYNEMKLDFDPSFTFYTPLPVTTKHQYDQVIEITIPFSGNSAFVSESLADEIKDEFKKHSNFQSFKQNMNEDKAIKSIEIFSSTAPLFPNPIHEKEYAFGPDHPEALVWGISNLQFSRARAEAMRNFVMNKGGLLDEGAGMDSEKRNQLPTAVLDFNGANKGQDGKPNGTQGNLCPYVKADNKQKYKDIQAQLPKEYWEEQRQASVRITFKVKVPVQEEILASQAMLQVGAKCLRVSSGCPK